MTMGLFAHRFHTRLDLRPAGRRAAKINKNKNRLEILGAFSNMFATSAARLGGQLRRHLFRHGCKMSTAVSGIVN
jgi:hypothetical protein